jgi:hypothetical protein
VNDFRSLFLDKCCIPETQVPYFLIWVLKYNNLCNGLPSWYYFSLADGVNYVLLYSSYEMVNGLLNQFPLHVAVIICGLSYQQPFKVRTGRLFIVNIVLHEHLNRCMAGLLLDRFDLHPLLVK